MIDYEVGQIPARPLGITVKDEDDNGLSLMSYSEVGVEILGSDDEEIDTSGMTVLPVDFLLGSYIVQFPRNKSLFEKPGTYKIRLRLETADGAVDYTRAREIRVKDFGRSGK